MSKRHRGFIEDYQPRASTIALLERVRVVLAVYAEHLPLTIRQIFYRLVGAPGEAGAYEKTEQAYERLGEAIGKARRAGLSTSTLSATTASSAKTRRAMTG